MSLTGRFFANGPSDWTLTHTKLACVLFLVRILFYRAAHIVSCWFFQCINELIYCTHILNAPTFGLFAIASFHLYLLSCAMLGMIHAQGIVASALNYWLLT